MPKLDIKKIIIEYLDLSENEKIIYDKMYDGVLDEKVIFERKIYGDWNCCFLWVSFFLHNFHQCFQNYVYDCLKDNIIKYDFLFPYVEMIKKFVTLKEYMQG